MGPLLVLAACCFLFVLSIPLILFSLTYVYRLSCVLCGLPRPSLLTASGVMLVTWIPDVLANGMMWVIVHAACEAAGLPKWEAGVIVFFLFLPIDLVICSTIEAGLMGVKIGKGIEVWFVQRLIFLAVLAAVAFVAAIVYLIQTMNG